VSRSGRIVADDEGLAVFVAVAAWVLVTVELRVEIMELVVVELSDEVANVVAKVVPLDFALVLALDVAVVEAELVSD
jgi:hypothetical protein